MESQKTKLAEARKTYETYWDSYTKGDLETFASTLDDLFEMIGTSESERCHTKADGIEFLKAQLHEIVGKAEMRNRQIDVVPVDHLVLINEQCDIYVLIGTDWNFYSKIRISTLLRETKEGWKVTQQHGSLPDMRVQEGETIALEKISKENLELRDAIKRRTIELENKSRELEIEASLERVRAVALGMQNPADILDICQVMFNELKSLGFTDLRNTIINFWDDSNNSLIDYDYSDFAGANKAKIAYGSHPIIEQFQKRIRKSKDSFAKLVVKKEYLESWKQRRRDSGEYEDPRLNDLSELYYYFYSIGVGAIGISTFGPLTNVNLDLLKRFRNVFEFAYRRYMDVAQAEAHARESEIDLALERVRAQTMAMHNSEDVGKCVVKMFSELTALGVDEGTRFGIGILNHDNENNQLWTARKTGEEVNMHIGNINMSWHPMLKKARQAWLEQVPYHQYVLEGEDLLDYYRMLNNAPDYKIQIPIEKLPEKEIQHCFIFEHGFFYAFSPYEFQPELIHITKRVSALFEQTYTRFLDLQKAEAQAREAQIEAALERVRSKAMSMHSSEDLTETIRVFYNQVSLLNGIPQRCGVSLFDKETHNSEFTSMYTTKEGKAVEIIATLKLVGHPILENMYEYWLLQKEYHPILRGQEIREYYQFIKPQVAYPEVSNDEVQYGYYFFFREGTIYAWTEVGLTESELQIYRKFTTVLSLTYKRYNDLKLAEAQAKEAKIEAALERVRSKSLAMHKSTELHEVVNTLYGEFMHLEINFNVVGIQLLKDRTKDLHLWISTADGLYDNVIHWPYVNMRNFNEMYAASSTQSPLTITLNEEETRAFFEEYFKLPEVPQGRKEATKAVRLIDVMGFYQKNTGIFLMRYTEGVYSGYEKDIIQRFSKVFEQAYTRFLDLQKAEAQALEVIKRASVDRVRAEIASMRTTSDLERIQPLIWNELNILGVPFIRCGVFIMDEAKQEVQAFLSTPDGKSIAAFHLPYHSTEQSRQIVAHWQQKKIFRDHMDEAAFAEYTQNLVQQGAVASDEKYVTENRPTDLYLHFLPFLQGMLYVGNDAPLKDEALQLVQNLADAFSTAYARYEDFNRLEIAKAEVEAAMSKLKATQSQLVQQEKLASLGQLTAGIAHEIKNPLNFVNNFSEVSMELVDEVIEERAKSQEAKDESLVDEILADIKSNLKKVHEHGSRANSIVSSMLQHSRGGSGKMEAADLNSLIREYVNLSFHGMRAGKNPIDVDIILDLDPEVKEVPLIKEDFSRVVINLCNNAFDAMRSKMYQVQSTKYEVEVGKDIDYLPKLKVITSLEKGQVLIAVQDNGPGIPDEIKDKILQPFFTTKKGTEGTGLGLSITHDIIKAHGGEIKVESRACEFTIFEILLPV